MFQNIDPSVVKSCLLHVFIYDHTYTAGEDVDQEKRQVDGADGTTTPLDLRFNQQDVLDTNFDYSSSPFYAGTGSVFGGRDKKKCTNCSESTPINVKVQLTQTMSAIGLKKVNMSICVVYESEDGARSLLENARKGGDGENGVSDVQISLPVVVGSMFEINKETTLSSLSKDENWITGTSNSEVKAAQTYLSLHGYYNGAMDGLFGPKTEEATLLFQNISGLASPDGIIDETTKRAMIRPRFDHQKDVLQQQPSSSLPNATSRVSSKYLAGDRVDISVGSSPGYLEREDVLSAVADALKMWEEASGVILNVIDRRAAAATTTTNVASAVVNLSWRDHSGTNDDLTRFDGPGGTIARATPEYVHLDSSELWCVRNVPSKPFAFDIYSVVLHEFGHVLGLKHSAHIDDVMSPFYSVRSEPLTENDVTKVREACGGGSGGGGSGGGGGGGGSGDA